MAQEAFQEIPEKFRGFYRAEFYETERGYRHFGFLSCKVCEKKIVEAYYAGSTFVNWLSGVHDLECPMNWVQKEDG